MHVKEQTVKPGLHKTREKQRHRKKPEGQKRVAQERIDILFLQAKEASKEDPQLAHRYVLLARTIAMKYKVSIPREWKRQFCHYCYSFLVPGKNCRVRLYQGKMVYYCLHCKRFMRYPYLAAQQGGSVKKEKTE
ncbi:ribonuclease P [Candidatus Woesearchaeota archaeon]|nr:ribonuclease P [Candidatus Woesearchaeota archaeon]